MNKFVEIMLDLVSLILAAIVLALSAYGSGAYLGQAFGAGNDIMLAMSVPFIIAAIVGSCMTYCAALKLYDALYDALHFGRLNRDNAQWLAGLMVGVIHRYTGKRYSKAERGTRWFSTVAANLNAEREPVELFPYK